MESLIYAFQKFEGPRLPGGERAGFFLGDGAGAFLFEGAGEGKDYQGSVACGKGEGRPLASAREHESCVHVFRASIVPCLRTPGSLFLAPLSGRPPGVGKGRQIAGMIAEYFALGGRRVLWVSVSTDLKFDAIRDLKVRREGPRSRAGGRRVPGCFTLL